MKSLRLVFVAALVWFELILPAGAQRANTYTHAPRSVRSRDVHQEHLLLELKIDLDNEQFHGRAQWTMSPFKPLRTLTLDCAEMKIEKIEIGDGEKPTQFRVNKQLTLVAIFVVFTALLASGTSSGQPDAAAPAPAAAPAAAPAPAAPAPGQIRFGGSGGGVGGGGFGGFGAPGGAQFRIAPNNGVVQLWGVNPTNPYNGQGNLTVNAIPDQNPKADEIAQVMRELRTTESPADKADLKMRLANAVTDYFDDDLKSRETELANLEERLKKLRTQLDRRRAAKDEIIELQLKVLTNDAEGLGFSNESDSRSEAIPVPNATGFYTTPGMSRQAVPPPVPPTKH